MPASATRKARRRAQFGLSPLPTDPVTSTSPDPTASAPSHGVSPNPTADAETLPDAPDAASSAAPSGAGNGSTKSKKVKKTKPAKAKREKKPRYILFIGNLPYTATRAGLEKHFAASKPTSVRLATEKSSGRSRGFGFVEFEDRKLMEACLGGWHRSIYREDDKEAATEPETDEAAAEGSDEKATEGSDEKATARRINVQLTAGGGGGSENRLKRLREKNGKLERERVKRATKRARRLQEGTASGEAAAGEKGSRAELVGGEDVHPSRRAQFTRVKQ